VKALQLEGQVFTYLTVIKRVENERGRSKWLCQCKCGKQIKVLGRSLTNGNTKSCGCWSNEQVAKRNTINEIGNVYGKLTVIEDAGSTETKQAKKWKCLCECGNIKITTGTLLRTGHTNSCGCMVSKGEQSINKILLNHNISFETQKHFDTCRFKETGKQASFDFYLPDYNCVIEYDDIQHFEYRTDGGWNNESAFIETQKRDNFKNEWCKENHINIIRIPYTHLKELTIEDLLVTTSSYVI